MVQAVCNLKKLKNVVGLCKEEDARYCKTGINLSLYYIVLYCVLAYILLATHCM